MLSLPTAGLLAQGQYDLDPLPPFPDHVQYTHYGDQIGKALPSPAGAPSPAMSSSSARDLVGGGGGPWLSGDLLCPWGWEVA